MIKHIFYSAIFLIFSVFIMVKAIIELGTVGGWAMPITQIESGEVIETGQCRRSSCAFKVKTESGVYYLRGNPKVIGELVSIKHYRHRMSGQNYITAN